MPCDSYFLMWFIALIGEGGGGREEVGTTFLDVSFDVTTNWVAACLARALGGTKNHSILRARLWQNWSKLRHPPCTRSPYTLCFHTHTHSQRRRDLASIGNGLKTRISTLALSKRGFLRRHYLLDPDGWTFCRTAGCPNIPPPYHSLLLMLFLFSDKELHLLPHSLI